jgi:hypothetical protein
VLERVRNNWELKLLSLVLAVAAWWYLRFAADPAIAAHGDQQLSVPLVAVGLQPDEAARFADKQALITVPSPRGGTTPLRPDDVRALVNVAGRAPGMYAIPVTVKGPAEIRSVEPADVTVQISRIVARPAAVVLHYSGDPRGVVASGARLIPDTVVLHGIADDVGRVATLRVDVPFPATAAALDEMVKPTPLDVRGDEVAGLQITPNYVRVRVAFAPGARAAQ